MPINFTESAFLSPEAREFFKREFSSDKQWYAKKWQDRYASIIYDNGVGLKPPMTPFEKELITARDAHRAQALRIPFAWRIHNVLTKYIQ